VRPITNPAIPTVAYSTPDGVANGANAPNSRDELSNRYKIRDVNAIAHPKTVLCRDTSLHRLVCYLTVEIQPEGVAFRQSDPQV